MIDCLYYLTLPPCSRNLSMKEEKKERKGKKRIWKKGGKSLGITAIVPSIWFWILLFILSSKIVFLFSQSGRRGSK